MEKLIIQNMGNRVLKNFGKIVGCAANILLEKRTRFDVNDIYA